MKLSIPTNWDNELVDRIPGDHTAEFYGKLHSDCVGGGRPAYSLPAVTQKAAGRHIRKIRSAGRSFNYLLNAACLGNRESTASWHRRFESFTGWLLDNGVDKITVSIPFLLEYLKRRHPKVKVSISAFAHVHSIRGALFFENRGADEITLSSSLNRNFHLLEELKTSVRTPLKLIVNNNCLLDCPLHIYHSNITAHASRLDERTRGFFIDYCRLSCRYLRLADPSNFLKADWIRPEDLQLYESMGIDRFKITDRALSTDAIIRISASYCARRHEGNLVDLFPQNKDFVVFRRRNPLRLFKYFFRPLRANPFKLYELTRLMKDAEVVIDNRALDGFLEDVRHKDCFSRSCGACGYCDKLAHSLVKINTPGITEQLSAYREFMQRLVQGDVFRY